MTFVDMHPVGNTMSSITGAGGGHQIGDHWEGTRLAGFWQGSSESFVDLHPTGIAGGSTAFAGDGVYQVGGARVWVGKNTYRWRASLWNGSAASWTDIHHSGYSNSVAYGIGDREIVGAADNWDFSRAMLWTAAGNPGITLHIEGSTGSRAVDAADGHQVGYLENDYLPRAALWSGSSSSHEDLHSYLESDFVWSEATGIEVFEGKTYVVGYGEPELGVPHIEAILWCALIRASSAFDVAPGTVFIGGLPQIAVADDRRLELRPDPIFQTREAEVAATFAIAIAEKNVDSLRFSIESRSQGGDYMRQTLSLFNFERNRFEVVDTSTIYVFDSGAGVSITDNVQRFIEPITGRLIASMTAAPVIPTTGWSLGIDKVWWTFPTDP
jgi:hypothetical protein